MGYRIEFDDLPEGNARSIVPLKFSKSEKQRITNEIDILLTKCAISACKRCEGDFISQIFTRPKKNSESLRVILNLKLLNKFVSINILKWNI